jgi:hypothetical protein
VAGDLSIIDPPRSGQRVVLRIPPELPADTVRAAPLPPLISTAAAAERRPRLQRVAARYEADMMLDASPAATEKPPVRIEVQLARVTPKSAPPPVASKHERKVA